MRPIRLDLSRARWSPNGGGYVVEVVRHKRKQGYFIGCIPDREGAARAIRTCRKLLTRHS